MKRLRRQPATVNETGGGSLEVVLIMPMLIIVITLVIQFALWSHATHVVVAAAQEGAQEARLQGGSAAGAKAIAADFIAQTAPKLILRPEVAASRTGELAEVSVIASVSSLIPGIDLTVNGRATGPVERYVSEGAGP